MVTCSLLCYALQNTNILLICFLQLQFCIREPWNTYIPLLISDKLAKFQYP